MKKKIFIYLVSSLISTFAISQEWQTVHAGSEFYFKGDSVFGSGYYPVRAVAIDSVRVEGSDTILYNFKAITQVDLLTYEFGPSWLGKKVVVRPDGMNIFFNRYGDSIFIDTRADTGSTWRVAKLVGQNYIQGRVISNDTCSFLGITDSCRIIELTAKNSFGNTIPHILNTKRFYLSRQNGLIKTFDMYNFPFRSANYTLIGRTNPEVGRVNLTAQEVFNYDVGDIFAEILTFTGMAVQVILITLKISTTKCCPVTLTALVHHMI